jgi:hypothetical protein
MAFSMPNASDYLTEEWLALREEIARRDGYRCRNCGFGDCLEVHHWLPLPEWEHEVDDRGYGRSSNPLIVHESGLITLCKDCHEALTKVRTERAILRNPELLKRRPPSVTEEPRNVFELWALNGETTPFRVVKETWRRAPGQYFLVEEVEVRKMPYGYAWGRYCNDGQISEFMKIGNAGTYTWFLYADPAGEDQ